MDEGLLTQPSFGLIKPGGIKYYAIDPPYSEPTTLREQISERLSVFGF
jgi:hypothetical protein